MIQNLLKASMLLAGYFLTGIGALGLFFSFKLLFDVFPELVMALVFGSGLTVLGLWILGKVEKIFPKRDKWYSDRGY